MFLIINAGSSTLKTALYDGEKLVARSLYEFGKETTFTAYSSKKKTTQKVNLLDTAHAFRHNIEYLLDQGVMHRQKLRAVVHRVVHGGEFYDRAVFINEKVKERIEALSVLAPLHNPPALLTIIKAQELLPKAKHIAIFDTAYHQNMPEKAYRYGISAELYEKHKIRKYGFHGTSHKYLAREAKRLTGTKKVITCHLGNGSSITANKNCKSIDTTMGFTPTDGLIMGTRSGALDPEVILYLLRQMRFSPARIDKFLNKESGLLGVSHLSGDVRDLWKKRKQKSAKLALDMLAYQIKKDIAMYHGLLGGADAIVFSGGIGEHAWYIRKAALEGLEQLGIRLHEGRNKKAIGSTARHLHTRASKVKILMIPANEELQMVREARLLCKQ